MQRVKLFVTVMLSFFLAFSPGAAWALSAEELLDLMVEEKVITPDKAEKIKQKARSIDKMKKAQEEAKRARELEQVKQEAKAEAKAEAIKEVKKEAKAMAKKAEPDWKAYWKNGLVVESKDKKNQIKVGGRVQVDFASISSPKEQFVDQVRNNSGGYLLTGFGTEFRRARLFVEGTVYNIIFFKAEYDFAGGATDFKDVYLGVKKIPGIGNIRIGHQKEPFSLEELTDSNYITFMERALPNVFSPKRNTGIMAYNTALKSEQLWWGPGGFSGCRSFWG